MDSSENDPSIHQRFDSMASKEKNPKKMPEERREEARKQKYTSAME